MIAHQLMRAKGGFHEAGTVVCGGVGDAVARVAR